MDNTKYGRVYAYLFDTGWSWSTAPMINRATGVRPVDLRALCQEYPSTFISSNEGYKLTVFAEPAEVQACVSALIARAQKIINRASALTRRLV